MRRIAVDRVIDAPLDAVEACWYDLERWPTVVDGCAGVDEVAGDWPRAGTTVRWHSTAHGRGSVEERVVVQEDGAGQTTEVSDPQLRGTQAIAFAPARVGGTRVTLGLEYELENRSAWTSAIVDVLFVRRALRDSLTRTLDALGNELEYDRLRGTR
jgi:uncharacterized membrane protein